MGKKDSTRRNFLKQISGTALALSTGNLVAFAEKEKLEERILNYRKEFSANDRINVAAIGTGIMGFHNIETAMKVPGVQLVAACDLYSGRLERTKELYGPDIFVTRDYRAILYRKDVDVVIISTADLWHMRIAREALSKGKHVYCEKPMVHKIEEGWEVIKAQRASNKVLQVGSQRVSSIIYAKAKELASPEK